MGTQKIVNKSTNDDCGHNRYLTPKCLGLRITDQETARVVSIHSLRGVVVGAGGLVSSTAILTCRHVVKAALLGREPKVGDTVDVTLVGVAEQPSVKAVVKRMAGGKAPAEDILLLTIQPRPNMTFSVPIMEFATPLRHSGKSFSVFGFPLGAGEQGRNVTGTLHAADAKGLVQMDRIGRLSVEKGFSGAPVWCPELSAFVGMVVSELKDREISWCIPSRILCNFYPRLLVRFRMPPSDRPHIHDYKEDDPNLQMFGSVSDSGARKLTAKIAGDTKRGYTVKLTYICHIGGQLPRGGYVTFITHPNFKNEGYEDAYELFSLVHGAAAKNEIYPDELFTVAAIGDAGDTALTLDLEEVKRMQSKKPKR